MDSKNWKLPTVGNCGEGLVVIGCLIPICLERVPTTRLSRVAAGAAPLPLIRAKYFGHRLVLIGVLDVSVIAAILHHSFFLN